MVAFLERKWRFSLIYPTKLLLIQRPGFFRDTDFLHMEALVIRQVQCKRRYGCQLHHRRDLRLACQRMLIDMIRTEFSLGTACDIVTWALEEALKDRRSFR